MLAANVLGLASPALAGGGDPAFEHRVLSRDFWAEGAAVGDLDGDGVLDVAAGSQWWRGPDFGARRPLRAGEPFGPHGYSDAFFGWTRDFDGDGRLDLLQVGFPGRAAHWLEEPGRASAGDAAFVSAHLVFPAIDNESPAFADLTGDGAPELVFQAGGRFGWAAPDPRDPRAEWRFQPISPPREGGPFVHGLGVGDVDGDGRADVLEKNGWWRQPPVEAREVEWTLQPVDFGAERGGAQMYAADLDGDGDADVATTLDAHGFGLAWHEQTPAGFVRHMLLGTPADPGPTGLAVSQLHAMAIADVDGDGLLDLATGKRWWAHGPDGDPEPGAAPLLVWIALERGADGELHPRAHQVDDDSGVGTALTAADVDQDGAVDFVVASKRGVFVHLQRRASQASPAGSWRPRWDGAASNLDLESGTLAGWLVEGEAFAGQPVRGDTVSARGREPSGHQGQYWIGGYELAGDAPVGRLTSQPFAVEAPWASFLVAGGAGWGTRVELLDEGGAPFLAVAGVELETLQRVVVDLGARVGRSISVRLVDEESGSWGHVNFDDFRFHAARPEPALPPGVPRTSPFDAREAAGLPPVEALHAMEVEEDWEVALLAAEPELHQPVALAVDGRGRLWVAEAFSYPLRREDGQGRDDILVFEDRDADGAFETRTVFASGLNLVSGLEVGHGGVFVGAAPQLLFIPDRDGDLVPDGNAVPLLDGFGFQDTHETLNSFTWGPDGWLWGCHGVFTHSRVGRPGARDSARVPLNAAVWRFDPVGGAFEVVAAGTSNPWGLDFDARGQAFVEACVVPHLWHVIPGARYERQAGEHFDPWVYRGISTIADHLHWAGADQWTSNGRSGALGGGHAHCGLLLEAGATPGSSRALIGNIHGNRVNADLVERAGSGYAASHGPDFLRAHDQWFRAVALRGGLSGEIYLIDWYDRQACHTTSDDAWDRTNGRLYRVAPAGWRPSAIDVEALDATALAEAAAGADPELARRARVWLSQRGAPAEARAILGRILAEDGDAARRLRALWALWASPQHTGIGAEALAELARDADEDLRGFAVRFLAESAGGASAARLAALADDETSSAVRLELASACQRLPLEARAPLIAALAARAEDAADQNLPLMLWYALAPLVERDPAPALALAGASPIASLAESAARRAGELATPAALEALAAHLAGEQDPARLAAELAAASAALSVRGAVEPPPGWAACELALATHADARVRERVAELAACFGDERALEALRALAQRGTSDLDARRRAVESLAARRDPGGPAIFLELLGEPPLAAAAVRALAPYADAAIGARVLGTWPSLDAAARAEAVALLSARAPTALALLSAVEQGAVERGALDAFARRQLELLGDGEVEAALARLFGRARPTRAESLLRMEELRRVLTPAAIASADRPRGRAHFERTCGSCHALFGSGGTLGPELTGSNRRDLGYLLANVLDPSAVVGADYQAALVRAFDGRTLTGVLERSTESEVVLRTQTGSIRLARADVEELSIQELSAMPEGLLDGLATGEIADLVAYVQGEAQCAIAAELALAPRIFDGASLAGWSGDPAVWSAENGAIVGRTDGLENNAFLVSELELGDFRLEVDVLLVGDQGNSGIQFRSRPVADPAEGASVAGYQADVGPGWWGSLYEEHGRGLLVPGSCGAAIQPGKWNRYAIEARGERIATWINGAPCIDTVDEAGARRGQIAVQVHSGGPTEVRFRGWKLELLAPDRAK